MNFCSTLLPMSTEERAKERAAEREAQRKAFARLLAAQLADSKWSQEDLVRAVHGKIGRRTVLSWKEVGGPVPQPANRYAAEDALGWKRDSITAIINDPGSSIFWDLKDVRLPDPATQPVERASKLSMDELLMELNRRVGALQEEVTFLREGSAPDRIYDLAAYRRGEGRNMEHLEGDE